MPLRVVKSMIAGIGHKEWDVQMLILRLCLGTLQSCFAQINAGGRVPALGRFHGVPAGFAAYIEDLQRFIIAQFAFNEVALLWVKDSLS